MSVDTKSEERASEPASTAQAERVGQPARPPLMQRIGASFARVEWGQTLLVAALMALAWCALFLASNVLQILAGIVPVMAGLFLGRRVKGDYLTHGFVLGATGFLIGLAFAAIYGALGQAGVAPMPVLQLRADTPPAPVSFDELLFVYTSFSLFALLPFPMFGTVMAGRAEQRNRETQRQIAERGGRLERPGVVRTLEDLQGLSLPQLGSYVVALYRKKGFVFKDYRFIDKDKHLDIEMEYEGERFLLRLTVADKVRPGTIESLVQDMKRQDIRKGVVIASTDYTPDALKAAAGRRNLVAINGRTLFEIAEG